VTAGILAGSIALVAFGLDSAIEGLASVIVIWRFTRRKQPGTPREAQPRPAAGRNIDMRNHWRLTRDANRALDPEPHEREPLPGGSEGGFRAKRYRRSGTRGRAIRYGSRVHREPSSSPLSTAISIKPRDQRS
jgi:hypothetical protein